MFELRQPSLHRGPFKSRLPNEAARLKTRSAGWNRAGWELNTLGGSPGWLERF